jgi:micrococcal nuclease
VSRVVDGDTVEISPAINGVEDVRLIGVDTPETVDPGEEVEPYGPQASAFATRELTGHRVRLGFDEERIDQYGRLLGYVYVGGSMFNEELVRKGYAQAYPYPPNTTYETKFAAAQNGARTAGRGIWGLSKGQQCKPSYPVRPGFHGGSNAAAIENRTRSDTAARPALRNRVFGLPKPHNRMR